MGITYTFMTKYQFSIRQKITSLFEDFHLILFQIGFQPIMKKESYENREVIV